MTESVIVKTTLTDILDLIKKTAETQVKESVISVNVKRLIEGLSEIEKEIREKHAESQRLWNKSVKLYQKFLREAPGSIQMSAPGPAPKIPSSLETVRGYILLFKGFVDEAATLQLGFLREVFHISSQALASAREIRDNYVATVSGAVYNVPQRHAPYNL